MNFIFCLTVCYCAANLFTNLWYIQTPFACRVRRPGLAIGNSIDTCWESPQKLLYPSPRLRVRVVWSAYMARKSKLVIMAKSTCSLNCWLLMEMQLSTHKRNEEATTMHIDAQADKFVSIYCSSKLYRNASICACVYVYSGWSLRHNWLLFGIYNDESIKLTWFILRQD